MSEGVVVVAGRYPAGSVVVLYRCDDERALRPGGDGTTEVGRKAVDEHGNVGFDGLEAGGLHLVEGYIDGIYTLMRVHSAEADDPNLTTAQPPAQNVDVKQGTQEAVVFDPPPNPPEDLPTGVPDGVALPQYEPDAQNTGGQADAVAPEQPSAPAGASDSAAPAPAADGAFSSDAPAQPTDAAAAPASPTDGSAEQAPPSDEPAVAVETSGSPEPVVTDSSGVPLTPDEPNTGGSSSVELTGLSSSPGVTTEPAPDVPEATVVDPVPPSADPATPDTPPTPEQEAAGQVADNTTPDAGSEAAPASPETDGQGQPVEQPAVLPDAVPVGTPPAPADAEPAEGNAPAETPAPVAGEPAPASAPQDAPPAEAAPAADEPAPETPASDAQAPSGAEQTAPSGAAEQPAADTPAPAEPSPPDQPATSG